jgi:DNA modification methylase
MKVYCKFDEYVHLSKLKNHPKNRNKHDQDQVDRLAKLYEYHGVRHPIIVSNLSGCIVAGHGRKMAAKKAGMTEFPVVYQDFENAEKEYAFLQADNAIASWAELDFAGINSDIGEFGPEFDLEMLGIKNFVVDVADKEPGCDEDEVPEHVEPKTKRGDIYKLGNHRLMCGDSTMIDDVEKLMDGEKADILHTDPPYNVDYSNQDRPKAGKTDLGRIENDSMTDESFKEPLVGALSNAFMFCKDDSTAYVWYASKESINFITSAEQSGWTVNQQIIWKKPMLLGRGRYQWAHEPCIFAVKGKPWFTDDRTKTTVWDFGGYDKSKNVHPTQKPVFLPEEALNNSSKIGSNVLDMFGGSGSTLMAAEKTNRNCFAMELDPHYCDVIVARWEKYTGKKAELTNG